MRKHHRSLASLFSAAAVVVLLLGAFARVGFAQTTSVQVFTAVPVTYSGDVTTPQQALSFAETALVLTCDETPEATLSSTRDGTGRVIVDNFLTVNGDPVCGYECFGVFLGNNGNATDSYTGIDPIDIGEQLALGSQLVTFELMDWGGYLASSDLWLVTNCDVPAQVSVCHKPGTPAQKTLRVAQSAIPGHLGHGDALGSCQ